MKQIVLASIYIHFIFIGYAQSNYVFSGSEVLNFDILDLSIKRGTSWSSERTSNPGYFSLIEQAKYIGYSDQANVDGYVKKYGNTPFLFPVGSGKDLRTLEISKPTNVTDAFATSWIEGDPGKNIDPTAPNAGKHSVESVTGPIVSVSKVGQWDWQIGANDNLGQGTTGNGVGLTITVSIPDMSRFANTSELRLVGWNGTAWIDLSGKPTATGNLENSELSGTMILGITAIAIGKIESIPDIKLKNIYVISSGCNTILKWETSFENSSSSINIEQSLDGLNFYQIASLPSTPSTSGNTYSKIVVQQFGVAYYRLKLINSNGTYSYSHVISFDNKCNEMNSIQIFPNPVADNEILNIRLTTLYEGPCNLMIQNSIGQIVYKKSVEIKQGINYLTPDIKNLSHGSYSIKITGTNGVQIITSKIFIKH
jgi:hypothetical protein